MNAAWIHYNIDYDQSSVLPHEVDTTTLIGNDSPGITVFSSCVEGISWQHGSLHQHNCANMMTSGGLMSLYSFEGLNPDTGWNYVALQVSSNRTFTPYIGIRIRSRPSNLGIYYRPTDIHVWIGEDPATYTPTETNFYAYTGRLINCQRSCLTILDEYIYAVCDAPDS